MISVELFVTEVKFLEKSPPTVELRKIDVGYGARPVLQGLSLSIAPGEFVALVGPNGSGKTTLLRAILGLEPLQKGERYLFGIPHPTSTQLAGRLVYVPQRMSLNRSVPLTVGEFLELRRARVRTNQSLHDVLKRVDLPLEIQRASLHGLSGGQMQRVFVAYALLGRPQLLALDEVTEGLDIKAQESLYSNLKESVRDNGASLILVSHDISAVTQFASRVICMNHSILFDGNPSSEEFHMCLHRMYGEKSIIHDHRH